MAQPNEELTRALAARLAQYGNLVGRSPGSTGMFGVGTQVDPQVLMAPWAGYYDAVSSPEAMRAVQPFYDMPGFLRRTFGQSVGDYLEPAANVAVGYHPATAYLPDDIREATAATGMDVLDLFTSPLTYAGGPMVRGLAGGAAKTFPGLARTMTRAFGRAPGAVGPAQKLPEAYMRVGTKPGLDPLRAVPGSANVMGPLGSAAAGSLYGDPRDTLGGESLAEAKSAGKTYAEGRAAGTSAGGGTSGATEKLKQKKKDKGKRKGGVSDMLAAAFKAFGDSYEYKPPTYTIRPQRAGGGRVISQGVSGSAPIGQIDVEYTSDVATPRSQAMARALYG